MAKQSILYSVSVGSIKFLGVILDEHLTWKEHIRYTENKVAKSIGLLYGAKSFLGKHSLLTLHYSYIHTYLNYANLSWASTNRSNLFYMTFGFT